MPNKFIDAQLASLRTLITGAEQGIETHLKAAEVFRAQIKEWKEAEEILLAGVRSRPSLVATETESVKEEKKKAAA